MERYVDRQQAGQVLATALKNIVNQPNVIVLALPRGGVPVAYEIANTLHAPLDVFIVRKLGVPGHEELAMGAVAAGGAVVYNDDILQSLHISPTAIEQVLQKELQELKRREKVYRDDRPFPNLANKVVILVDDGIATGATMRAAIQALQQLQPLKLIVAVPVSAQETYEEIQQWVDDIVCPLTPRYFNAVGAWYEHFPQTEDAEVHQLLAQAAFNLGRSPA